MAKKKSSSLNIVSLVLALVGVVAVVLYALLPMVKSTITITRVSETVTFYKGFGMIFGGTVTTNVTATSLITDSVTKTTGEVKDVAFNTGAFFAFLLVLLGAILAAVIPFVKALSKNKLFTLLAGVLMVVGGILMFCSKGFAIKAFDASELADIFALGYGAIIAGVLSLLAGVATVVTPFLKK